MLNRHGLFPIDRSWQQWLGHFWADDCGAEITEWVVVVAFVLVTGVAVYNLVLINDLNLAIAATVNRIENIFGN